MSEPTKAMCPAKHTPYDPPRDGWVCPQCKADGGMWYIDEPADGATDECLRLHAQDGLYCAKCGHHTLGYRWATALMKQKSLVQCPTCKGHGVVKGTTASP